MLDDNDFTRIDRYLAGECTPAEAAEVERWIEGDADRRQLVASLSRAGRAGDWHADSSVAWARVRRDALGTSRTIAFPRPRAMPAWAWQTAAAVALLAAGLGLWSLRQRASHATATVAMAEAVAPVGRRASVTLPDGSHVLLAPESRLRWAAGLRGGTRDVSLEGEGYFSVTHDAGRPFVVRAGAATARVLGTRFVVRARPGEGPVRVAVAEGRVLVRGGGSDAGSVLARGDLGTVQADRVEVQHGADLDAELDWTTGRLVFQDVPVPAAFVRLERWYGVKLVAGDATVAGRRFSGTIENLAAAELVQALSLALDARVEQRDGAVTFHARGPR